MESFVRHPDNSRDFQSDIILEATGIGSMDKMQLKIEIRHKSNWHNENVRAARRSKFMCALVLALRKVPIYGPGGGGEALGGATNPGYSVAVNDSFAAEAREKAAKAKEGKRLIPSKPKGGDDLGVGPKSEAKAADSLNARRPTEDPSAAWGARDDVTLGSRDHSVHKDEDERGLGTEMDRKRSQEIDDLKQTLLKRESTRGRRRPGEHLPSSVSLNLDPGMGYPGMMLTPAAEERGGGTSSYFGNASQVVDEEAGLGLQPTAMQGAGMGYGANGGLSNNPYTIPSLPQQQSQQQSQNGGYSMFPTQSTSQGAGGNGKSTGSTSRRLSLGFKKQREEGGGGVRENRGRG